MKMEDLTCRMMAEGDIDRVVPLYIDHYNTYEEGEWTQETTYKRIHQVWSREDSACMIMERGSEVIGFVIGYFEQYDDSSQFTWRIVWRSLKKLKLELPYDPAIPLLGIYPEKTIV